MIEILDKDELDISLKDRWGGMKTALLEQQVSTAVSYFMEETKGLYDDMYTTLFDSLPQIAAEIQQQEIDMGGSIQMVYATGSKAKYRIIRNEVHAGQPDPITYPITYYIYFGVDQNGLWKIYKY